MNDEADRMAQMRKAETAELGGERPACLHVLKHLKVKTVIKENHVSPVHQLVFNHTSPTLHNLFATVGKDQATVYDDWHLGDFVSVVVHFSNQKTEHVPGGELQAAAWVDAGGCSPHPFGDAWLAVAGADHNIAVISTVESQVIKLLKGHTKDVMDLAASIAKPGLLVSLSKDGNVRVWNVVTEQCLASYTTDANCVAVHPEGSYFVTAGRKGAMHVWDTPSTSQPDARSAPAAGRHKAAQDDGRHELTFQTNGHTESIDCMRFLPGNRLVTKSIEGRMFVWDMESKSQITTWKVPSCNPGLSMANRCQFGSSPNGNFVCVGNTMGDVFVYDTAEGTRLAQVAPVKVTAPVKACGMSNDCRHLLAAIGKGFIFRFEYIRPDPEKPGQEDNKENAAANSADVPGPSADTVTEMDL